MKRKIYVTEAQARQLMKILKEEVADNQKTLVSFTGDNATELGQNAMEKSNDAQRAGIKQDAITLDGKTRRNNASDKEEVVIAPDPNATTVKDGVTNAVNNAVRNGVDINKLHIQTNVGDVTNGTLAEGITYRKSDIENFKKINARR